MPKNQSETKRLILTVAKDKYHVCKGDSRTLKTVYYELEPTTFDLTLGSPELTTLLTTGVFSAWRYKVGPDRGKGHTKVGVGTRNIDNTVALYAIPLDFDGTLTRGDVIERLKGIAAIVYPSTKSTPKKPRIRVLLPLSEPITDTARFKPICEYLKTQFPKADQNVFSIGHQEFGCLEFYNDDKGKRIASTAHADFRYDVLIGDYYTIPDNVKAEPQISKSDCVNNTAGFAPLADDIERANFALEFDCPEGMRDDGAYGRAILLRKIQRPLTEIRERLHQWNVTCCKPPLESSVIDEKIESAMRRVRIDIGYKWPELELIDKVLRKQKDTPAHTPPLQYQSTPSDARELTAPVDLDILGLATKNILQAQHKAIPKITVEQVSQIIGMILPNLAMKANAAIDRYFAPLKGLSLQQGFEVMQQIGEEYARLKSIKDYSAFEIIKHPDRIQPLPKIWTYFGWPTQLTILYGESGCGKSTLARQMALVVLKANPLVTVCYITFDTDGADDIARDLANMPIKLQDDRLQIFDANEMDNVNLEILQEWVDKRNPSLTIIDNLIASRLYIAPEIENLSQASEYVELCRSLKNLSPEAATILIHHTAENSAKQFGSMGNKLAANAMIYMRKPDHKKEPRGENIRVLHATKLRAACKPLPEIQFIEFDEATNFYHNFDIVNWGEGGERDTTKPLALIDQHINWLCEFLKSPRASQETRIAIQGQDWYDNPTYYNALTKLKLKVRNKIWHLPENPNINESKNKGDT